jgi:hypothetical protein
VEELFIKVLSDSILAVFLIAAMYFLRPVLRDYLQQQIAQLTKLTELVETLVDQQETFAERLEHVEDLLGLVAAERRTPVSAASVNQPTRRSTRRKAETSDAE